jgi:uncharacterized protein (DUF2141 family)
MSLLDMKRAGLCLLALVAAAAPAAAQNSSTAVAVEVEIAGIETRTGYIRAALYPDGGWSQRPVDGVDIAVGPETVRFQMTAPAPGLYAVRLFHDVDGDGQMNANLMGIPTEPFGTSNDAPPRFGPPAFEEAVFEVGADGAVQIITLQG